MTIFFRERIMYLNNPASKIPPEDYDKPCKI